MAGWRTLTSLAIALASATTLQAQTYSLTEAPLVSKEGRCFRVEMTMDLTGEVKVRRNDQNVTLKQVATARHEFHERVLEVTKEGSGERSARVYKTAEVEIGSGQDASRRTLRPERSFLVAHRLKDQFVSYSPKGPLTREEQEITEHFDTLSLPGLLPGKDVAVGDTWRIANAVVQGLCDLDGLIGNDLTGKLETIKDEIATISVKGAAEGIDLGAAVKLQVQATCKFDLKAKRITNVDWQQTDEREQGPVSPALKFDVTFKVTRTEIEPVTELSDLALVPIPNGPPDEKMTQIHHAEPKGRYELVHAREWLRSAWTDDYLVLRLVDRGDFVAQVTVKPWTKAEPGKHLDEKDFIAAMSNAPGWNQKELVKEPDGKEGKVIDTDNKNWIFRVQAVGDLDDVEVMQYFYLIAGPEGDQIVITFTLSPNQAQRLGTRDLPFVRGVSFPGRPIRVHGSIGH